MVNVAIIGCGAISATHIASYLRFPQRCSIYALCDANSIALQEKIQGIPNALAVSNYTTLLNDKNVDAVSICTPPALHTRIAVEFLNAGKHVLVEKPLAPSPADCAQIIEAAKKSKKIVASVAQNRFLPSAYKVKKIIDSGVIGKINHIQVDALWWRGKCYYDLSWRGTWESESGGCTLNHAVHHVDLLLYFAGMPKTVFSFMTNTAHPNSEVEDLSVSIFQYADGSLGQLTASVAHHGEEQKITLQGERASVSVPFSVSACSSLPNGFPTPNTELEEKIATQYAEIPDLPFEGHCGQIDDFLSAIEHNRAPSVPAQEGARSVELITAVYKSAITKQVVSLPLSRDDNFYTKEGLLRHVKPFNKKTKNIERFETNDITIGGKSFG